MSKILTSSKKRSAFFASLIVKMCAIAGIAAMAVSAQTDLARGKTATASSTEGSYIASNAVDGNSGTRWASLFMDNQSITIDLGASYSINRVRLTWETASAMNYQIEISSNGNDPWTPITFKSNMPAGNNRVDDITGLTASSRYIRMYGTARTTQYGYSLFSFEVYGSGATNYTLSTSVSPAGTGTVSLNPAGGSYAAGTAVTVTASAASGYQFNNWSGVVSVTSNPVTITMNGNYSIAANFTPVSGGYQAGDMNYYNGSAWTRIPRGTSGQVLTESATQVPAWTSPAVVTDIDGNLYTTVTIGTQTWMKQDLKTTRFNDGTPIPNVTDNLAWDGLRTPGYCWHQNIVGNSSVYGAFYNGYVVNTGRLAPKGWHVPTDAEWTTLENFLGGNVGGKLKEAGLSHWLTPNTGATNETGFSAFGGGCRAYDGTFGSQGGLSYWWSATESVDWAWLRSLSYDNSYLNRGYVSKNWGLSVRLVRD